MLHAGLPYFWGDISIYPGNSDGPVIEGDKIVGVVSAQPTLQGECFPTASADQGPFEYRIPFGKIIKARFIWKLLAEQLKKDEKREEFRKPPSAIAPPHSAQ